MLGLIYNNGCSDRDFLMIPKKGILKSRSEAKIDKPFLMTAPMDSILDQQGYEELCKNNYCLPLATRKLTMDLLDILVDTDFPETLLSLWSSGFLSFGINEADYLNIKFLIDVAFEYEIRSLRVCIDIAHGCTNSAIEFYDKITAYHKHKLEFKRETNYKLHLMFGSIATGNQAIEIIKGLSEEPDYYNYLDNIIFYFRVGIGGGSACSTRKMTGVGIPTFSSVRFVTEALSKNNNYEIDFLLQICINSATKKIVADGGIYDPGTVNKYLALGVDYCMIGRAFAECTDSIASKKADNQDNIIHSGQASEKFQLENYGKIRNECPEGESLILQRNKLTMNELITRYVGGLRSLISYLGFNSLEELRNQKVDFVRISDSSIKESKL